MLIREFSLEGPAAFGRSLGNGARVVCPTILGRPAQVARTAEGFVATDLGNRDGPSANGRRTARAVLRPTGGIPLGNHLLVFKDSVADRPGDAGSIRTRVL